MVADAGNGNLLRGLTGKNGHEESRPNRRRAVRTEVTLTLVSETGK